MNASISRALNAYTTRRNSSTLSPYIARDATKSTGFAGSSTLHIHGLTFLVARYQNPIVTRSRISWTDRPAEAATVAGGC
jgi:hypothetical protein